MKFGIIGSGIMAKIYGQILKQHPLSDLVAIVGNSPEKAKELGEVLGVKTYVNGQFDEMLKNHPDIDSIIVTTPEWVRAEPIQAVVKAKKHLLLEKPFADNWNVAKDLTRVLSEHQKYFGICHVLRHSPRFYGMKQAIVEGKIGDVRHIYARRNSNNKRVHRVLGKTDLAFWLSPHDVDIMRWVTNSEVESVYASARNGARTADDYLTLHLKFQNQVDGVLEISWCTPPLAATAREALFEVRGTKGVVELIDSDMNVNVYSGDLKSEAVDTYEDFDVYGVRHGMFYNLIDNFIREASSKTVKKTSAATDGLETIRVGTMIRKSLDEKRVVLRSEIE